MNKLHLQKETSLETGLTSSQLDQEIRNAIDQKATKSYKSIFLEHFFTFFNLINIVLAVLVILTGSWRNALFMGVVAFNLVVGLFQEIRSKRVLDKLALIYQDRIHVRRDGQEKIIPVDEIRLNDLILLHSGDQVPVDGIIREGSCQVNESVLTGESEPVDMETGSSVYAGCFLVSGSCTMQAAAVGNQTYMSSLLGQAKRSKRYPSSLRDALEKIIRFCGYLIIPIGILLFAKSMVSGSGWRSAVLSSVAAMVGMIPEGLVVLTSIALAAASMMLAARKVLVQELYCVETLARVNVLCLDKTGTITEGTMSVTEYIPVEATEEEMKEALCSIYRNTDDLNVTAQAILKSLEKEPQAPKPEKVFPFSSAVKAMGALFDTYSVLVGAYGFIQAKPDPEIEERIASLARKGYRILAVMKAPRMEKAEKGEYACMGLIVLEDNIRKDAAEILSYFEKQDVRIKIISGDDPLTVAAIAAKVGVKGKAVNMSMPLDEPLEKVMEEASIFGRVTPDQKKEMVLALKKDGDTVAMTGDGVNDVLALKEADCSIAMGSGTQAARAIASIVLLQDQFDVLPFVLAQGRRVINNITRTASLFLVKTLFSFGLSVLTIFWLSRYPFEPIQLTLISMLTTGIPSFVLTLEPNEARVTGRFLPQVLSRALPGALSLVLAVIILSIASNFISIPHDNFSTICTWLAGMNALGVLIWICTPFTLIRKVLVITMTALFIGLFFGFQSFFGFVPLDSLQLILCGGLTVVIVILQLVLFRLPWLKWLEPVIH